MYVTMIQKFKLTQQASYTQQYRAQTYHLNRKRHELYDRA